MDNQQLYNLDENVRQLLLTAKLGDGHLTTPKNINSNSSYITNCKHLEYLQFKQKILKDLSFEIGKTDKNGFSQTPIYILTSKKHSEITKIRNMSIEETVNNLDEFGIALWFYDDGSLHNKSFFYNLNTHKFSKDIQEEIFIPFFNKHNIFPKVTKEVKKDGRVFHYLRISRFEGSYEISEILKKYPIKCYSYKVWSSEASQRGRKAQACLKSMAIELTNVKIGKLLKFDSIEDMVQSLEKFKASRWYKARSHNSDMT